MTESDNIIRDYTETKDGRHAILEAEIECTIAAGAFWSICQLIAEKRGWRLTEAHGWEPSERELDDPYYIMKRLREKQSELLCASQKADEEYHSLIDRLSGEEERHARRWEAIRIEYKVEQEQDND